MENPHEVAQNALWDRIIANVERLNENVGTLNRLLAEVNRANTDVELLAQMWDNYQRSAQFHLEVTGQTHDPL